MSSQVSSRQNSKDPTDGVGLGAAAGLDVGLGWVGEGAAEATELLGGSVGITTRSPGRIAPVGIMAPEIAHQELVLAPIVYFERPALAYPEVQKPYPLTLQRLLCQ